MKFIALTLLLLSFSTSLSSETPEAKGLRIATQVDREDRGFEDFLANVKMELVNKQKQTSSRIMKMKTLEMEQDGDKTLIVFDHPKDVKGSAVLTYTHKVGSDDQWLYLPAIKRVKRISSKNKSGPFMGSEFAYEDLASQEIEKYSYKFLEDQTIDGKQYQIIERDPVDPNSGYSTIKTWIDTERLIATKHMFYDRKNSLLKTLTLKDFQKYEDKHWRPGIMHMVNHQKQKETILTWSDYDFKKGLNDKDFHQNALKRAR